MALPVRSVLAIGVLLLGGSCTTTTWTSPQGWSAMETWSWQTASQGSRLVPRVWLDNLEQPETSKPFLDAAYIAGFRYLPAAKPPEGVRPSACSYDPALPLGFAIDCQSDTAFSTTKLRWKAAQSDAEPWVGLNCSACHTAQLQYNGRSVQIEGGPTLADFQGMTGALEKSLSNTATQPDKFSRFATAVLGASATDADRAMLMAALVKLNAWNASLAGLNQSDSAYGFGRLDAIGHIFNKAALLAMPQDGANQTPNPSDAPVSYPFLWNVTQLNKVEWNGLADNIPLANGVDVGALGRNSGEVIGVFGDVTIAKPTGLGNGYVSSLRMQTLIEMEQAVSRLLPPKWPSAFGALDRAKVARGQSLYTSLKCDQCHAVPTATWQATDHYTVALIQAFAPPAPAPSPAQTPTGTDIWMACNTALDRAKTGAFRTADAYFGGAETTSAETFNVNIVKNAVIGTILNQKTDVAEAGLAGVFGFSRGLPPPQIGANLAQGPSAAKIGRASACLHFNKPEEIVYKARPLQGIWATAPYLHNGSVPTLYDLLAPAKRPAVFYTGTRNFDPKNVGFISDQSDPANTFKFDTSLDGNSNAGHDYGASTLKDDDRYALVEYLKSL
jgi:hypothetical protein